ncbi:MAG: thioredoxin family protein [Bacilli bacterium]|nr:thioredoxin family protein [Bacilli bacterium]
MKILRISAIWCPACLIMRPIYEEVAKKYGFETSELDYDFDEDEVKKLDVGNKLPVAIIYDNDHELVRICGEKKQSEIEKIIEGLK